MNPEKTKERFPGNVEGPLFVANGECISCMAPEQAAPDLMGYDLGAKHCYFKKQPTMSEEVDRAVRAVLASRCGALYYSGNDPMVHQKFAEPGREDLNRMLQHQKGKSRWWKFW